MRKLLFGTAFAVAVIGGWGFISAPKVQADIVYTNQPTPAPTAVPVPTFPSTGNFGVVVPYSTETDNGNSSTSKTINWSTGGAKQKITTTGSCTLTFTAPAGPATLLLKIVHEASATAYTYTWPASVKWPAGAIFTTSNTTGAIDLVTCYYDGTIYACNGNATYS